VTDALEVLRHPLALGRDLEQDARPRPAAAGELAATADARALARSLTAFAQGAAVMCQVWRDPRAIRETMLGARALLDAQRAHPRAQ